MLPEWPHGSIDLFLRSSIFEFLLRNQGIECVRCTCPEETTAFLPPGWESGVPTAIFVTAHDYTVEAVIRGIGEKPHRTRIFAVMTGELSEHRETTPVEMIHIDPFLVGVKAAQMLCRRIQQQLLHFFR